MNKKQHYERWFEQYKVDVPEGRSGAWAITSLQEGRAETRKSLGNVAVNSTFIFT